MSGEMRPIPTPAPDLVALAQAAQDAIGFADYTDPSEMAQTALGLARLVKLLAQRVVVLEAQMALYTGGLS